jgi:carbonic anhydrase
MKLQRETRFLTTAVACAALLGGMIYWQAGPRDEPPGPDPPVAWDAPSALAALRAGNVRFVESSRTLSTDTAHDSELRHQTAKEQHPFAVILCCSDSRVIPEFIFDQRAGSIFEIRNAGNVVDEDVLASFEYAVAHLKVPLMVVLGHKGCGAVHAVYEAEEEPLHDHLRELQRRMSGIHQDILNFHNHDHPHALDELSKMNAGQQALALIRDSRILQTSVNTGEVRLLYAIYDMETGSVEFFHPSSND